MSVLDIKQYTKYPEEVLAGNIIVNQYIKYACQRFMDWLQREDIEFRKDKADHAINYIQNLEHYQAPFTGQKLLLEDWQKFFLGNVYGWYYKDSDKRVIRHVILDIPRKAGKSTIGAAMALYGVVSEGHGVEIDIVSNTRQQGHILYDMCDAMSKRMDKKRKYFKQTLNKIKLPIRESYIQVLASDSCSLDGYGSQLYIYDEFHAAKDTKLWDVLASSQGARHNPLSVICTTAGNNLSGPYFTDMRKGAIDMLSGLVENDSLFALIYTLDEGDDYEDPEVWYKVNPNLGVTIGEDYIKDRINQIKTNPGSEADVLTKTFNVWVQSKTSWLSDTLVYGAMENVDLSKLVGEVCYSGADLSSVSDLTSISLMFPPNADREYYPDKFIFKSIPYVPGKALTDSNPNINFYRKAISCGHLKDTNSKAVDYEVILKDLLDIQQNVNHVKCSYDKWNSIQFKKHAADEGVPMVEFGQSLQNFNIPTKEFERLLREGKLVIDANVVTRWCFGNASLKTDHIDNCKPVKSEDDKNKKIDVVISMIEALGGWLLDNEFYFETMTVENPA